jgi:hypothetical protein
MGKGRQVQKQWLVSHQLWKNAAWRYLNVGNSKKQMRKIKKNKRGVLGIWEILIGQSQIALEGVGEHNLWVVIGLVVFTISDIIERFLFILFSYLSITE